MVVKNWENVWCSISKTLFRDRRSRNKKKIRADLIEYIVFSLFRSQNTKIFEDSS